jgi:hypothetical protein
MRVGRTKILNPKLPTVEQELEELDKRKAEKKAQREEFERIRRDISLALAKGNKREYDRLRYRNDPVTRQKRKQYSKEWSARLKQDPEKYELHKAKNRERAKDYYRRKKLSLHSAQKDLLTSGDLSY